MINDPKNEQQDVNEELGSRLIEGFAFNLQTQFDQQNLPMLAHYTSIHVVQSILENREIWFSNPLLMNDVSELSDGIFFGHDIFASSKAIEKAVSDEETYSKYRFWMDHYLEEYIESKGFFDTYALCLSQHENTDGTLSMWREYGAKGEGVAIVFDPSKFAINDNAILIAGPVLYKTQEERKKFLEVICGSVADFFIHRKVDPEDLHKVAFQCFHAIKLYALFIKHKGFEEEKEWRVVYMKENDPDGRFSKMFGHFNGPRGLEPKLRYKILPEHGDNLPEIDLEEMIDHILLGPTSSDEIALLTARRMVRDLGFAKLEDKIKTSKIPLRRS